jgi:hypothetical protein
MLLLKRSCVVLLLMSMAACNGGNSTPTAPSIAQVSGVWTGTVTQTSASGGECVGTLFAGSNGVSSPFTVSITQSGSSLNATASSQTTGQSCTYTGTAGSNTIALNVTTCTPVAFQIRCANNAVRDIYLVTRSVTGTLNGNMISGTTGETWNVFASGTTTNGLGVLVVNNGFSFSH